MADAAKITLTGHVQGVGFRPFVYRLATKHHLTGYVQNCLGEVAVVACGPADALERFKAELIDKAPPLARPRISHSENVETRDFDAFTIIESAASDAPQIFVPADNFMCDDCRRELHDPSDRRYRYPFINCTQCGPRYTLIQSLPYDRVNTSMASFPLCDACEQEYRDPMNRRFHAEPVACPECGPHTDRSRQVTLDALHAGRIVAVKGIGGYHLMCDAQNADAVAELRRRKPRPHKPLAVMFPMQGVDGLDAVREQAAPTAEEAALIVSSGRPVVLVQKRSDSTLVDGIAPGLAEVGVFLPYSPLHDLLLDAFAAPLVATSGNVSGEPVLTDNHEASTRLAHIADAFVHHNRPIVRPADDPVHRRICGTMRPIRIGRGCAPLELDLPLRLDEPLLAVGGHMKNTIALGWDGRAVVSPHIGEMDSPRSLAVLEQLAADLQRLYGVGASRIVCDAHPGYTTHRWARQQPSSVQSVWHHEAHASAAAGEHGGKGQWLVFAWDGVGLGRDGTLWGGETLLGRPGNWRRFGSLRTFRLPGGERAGREPWRSAAAMQWECGRDTEAFPDESGLARTAWQKGINCPATSAAGRVFDAAAAMILGFTHASFEAQGPMMLEALCERPRDPVPLMHAPDADGVLRADWEPLLDVLGDRNRGRAERAEVFHSSMAHAALQQARAARDCMRIDHVAMCGGVFQNRILAEQVLMLLQDDGFDVFLPEILPCNDAALSFGQIVEVAARDVRD